jgi:prepilin-type N-terminal cleavage/methylation domain-containing protein
MKARVREAGFTLVEIAIVLVIIGLLLGGVLKGQELINSARVRNIADQDSAVQAAYYGFIDRYRAVPGDMLATQVCGAIGNGSTWTCPAGPAPGGTGTTGGDGKITTFGEASAVWAHLSAAGFLQGGYPGTASDPATYTVQPAIQAPTNAFNGFLLLGHSNDYQDTAATPPPKLALIIGKGIPVKLMRELDLKIDDSFPERGVLRAAPNNAAIWQEVGAAGSPTGCVLPGNPASWDLNDSTDDCNGYYLF